MKKSILVKSLLVAASLPLFAGCAEREAINGQPAVQVAVQQPLQSPPMETEVVPPSPDVTYVWVPGSWEWNGHWLWVAGRWTPRPYPGAVWTQGDWQKQDNGYVWVRGHWH